MKVKEANAKRSFKPPTLKKNFKPKPKPNAPKTRKELRKEERKNKKAEKHSFLLKRLGKTPEAPPKKKRRQTKKKKRKNLEERKRKEKHGDRSSEESGSEGSSDLDTPRPSFKEEEEKLQKEMEEVRKKRMIEDNADEEKTIRSLHKKLKLSKKAIIPASFRVDGLDYLLEFCNELDNKKSSKKDKDASTSDDEIEDSNENESAVDDSDLHSDSAEEEEDSEGEEFQDEISEDEAEQSDEDNDHEPEQGSDSESKKDSGGVWEDIYGRMRDKDGNVIENNTIHTASATPKIPAPTPGKYVPPMRRENQNARDIKKSLKGLLNRLSESNMHNLAVHIEDLYMRNSRNEMNESLLELLEAVLVGPVLSSERIVLEHVMLIAILHANVGTEIGAFFIQNFVQKFHALYQKFDVEGGNSKELENFILIISYMYHFKIVDCCLIYDILNFLGTSFGDKDVELILTVLRSIGFRLRKDDPASLKSLILLLQQKASQAKSANSSSRVKFMLEILLAIRNNNMSKIPNYDPSFGEHLLKVIKSFLHKGNYVSELKISMQDLLNADTKGKWWIVGSAWTNVGADSGKPESEIPKSDAKVIKANEKLLAKAKRLGMNTDTRRNIFFILMTAEDYLDAFEKLVQLGLKNQLERKIIHVLIYCCLHEKKFNPYYAFLASKFCQLERRFVLTIQYTLWDRLKNFGEQESHHLKNISHFLIHLINDRSLPITVLKVIDFADMNNSKLAFLKDILKGILLQSSVENIEEIFIKPALSEKLHLFRESLKLFMNHFMLNNGNLDGEAAEPLTKDAKTLAVLKERIRIAEKAMSLGSNKLQL